MMVFSPLFGSEAGVEAILGMNIDANTIPSTSNVLDWLEEVEYVVNYEKLWGYFTVTNELVDSNVDPDVPWSLLEDNPWRYFLEKGESIIPRYPIYSVTTLYVNEASYGSAEDWQQRTEGHANDFIVTKRNYHGTMIGKSIIFHSRAPKAGIQRVKMTYVAGMHLSATALREYVNKRVSIRVLEAKTSSPDLPGFDLERGSYAELYRQLKQRVKDIELELPPPPRQITVL